MKEQQHKQKTWLLMENPNGLLHLTVAFDHHRGMCRGATGAAPIFEVHLKFPGRHELRHCCQCKNKLYFMENHINTDHNLHLACRTCRRPNCCARHKQQVKCQNKLYDTQFSMYQALTECRCYKRCSRCRGAPVGLKQHLEPNVCHNFGLTGHWHRDYPKKNRGKSVFPNSDWEWDAAEQTPVTDQPALPTHSTTLVIISPWLQLNNDCHWICWG